MKKKKKKHVSLFFCHHLVSNGLTRDYFFVMVQFFNCVNFRWNLILLFLRPEMVMTLEVNILLIQLFLLYISYCSLTSVLQTIKLERMKKEKGLCSVVPLPPDTLGKELTEIISMKRYLIHPV